MRILAVTYCRAMLGANKALLNMIKDMRTRYHVEFTVLMPSVNDGNLAEALDAEQIPYIIASMKMWVMPLNARYKALRSISAQLKTIVLSKRVLQRIKSEKYDLIYTNNSTVQYGAIIAKKMGIPHVWHIREFGKAHYDYDYSFPLKKRVRYFNAADKAIAISDAIAEYAKNELCPGAEIQRIYDGIEIKKTSKEKWNRESPLRIVYVAALQPGKNQMELIMAAEKLICQENLAIEIYLVGDGNEYRAELELYVAQHRLSKHIIFLGYREDVADLLDTMDIGVICSKAEGFGLVTCEYMEASLPVIGAKSGATPEIILDGETGYLYPVGDVNSLAKHLKEYYENRQLIEEMGKAGYRRVVETFDRKKNTDEMYTIMCECVQH